MNQLQMGCGHVSAWLWVAATLGMCSVCSVDALGVWQGTVFESTAAPGGNNALYLHLTSQGGAFVAGNEIAVGGLVGVTLNVTSAAGKAVDLASANLQERAQRIPLRGFSAERFGRSGLFVGCVSLPCAARDGGTLYLRVASGTEAFSLADLSFTLQNPADAQDPRTLTAVVCASATNGRATADVECSANKTLGPYPILSASATGVSGTASVAGLSLAKDGYQTLVISADAAGSTLPTANRLNNKNVTIEEHPDPPPLPDFIAPFNFILASRVFRITPAASFVSPAQVTIPITLPYAPDAWEGDATATADPPAAANYTGAWEPCPANSSGDSSGNSTANSSAGNCWNATAGNRTGDAQGDGVATPAPRRRPQLYWFDGAIWKAAAATSVVTSSNSSLFDSLVSTDVQHLAPFVILHVFADGADGAGDVMLDVRREDKVNETSTFWGFPNTISVAFRVKSRPLVRGSVIKISGLNSTLTPSNSALAVTSDSSDGHAGVFRPTAMWDATGLLTLQVSNDGYAAPGARVLVSFTLRNGNVSARAGVYVDLEGTLPGFVLRRVSGGGPVLSFATPQTVTSLSLVSASSIYGAANAISIAFSVNFRLPPLSTVTISGISGVITEAGTLAVSGARAGVFGSSCSWKPMVQRGQMLLTIPAGQALEVGAVANLSVSLTNANGEQPSVSLTADATAVVDGYAYGFLARNAPAAPFRIAWHGAGKAPARALIDRTVFSKVELATGEGVEIPAGAFPEGIPAIVGVTPVDKDALPSDYTCKTPPTGCDLLLWGTVAVFTPSPVTFLKNVTLKLSVDARTVQNARLAIHRRLADGGWEELHNTTVDAATGIASAPTDRFSTYAVLRVTLPISRFPERAADYMTVDGRVLVAVFVAGGVVFLCCVAAAIKVFKGMERTVPILDVEEFKVKNSTAAQKAEDEAACLRFSDGLRPERQTPKAADQRTDAGRFAFGRNSSGKPLLPKPAASQQQVVSPKWAEEQKKKDEFRSITQAIQSERIEAATLDEEPETGEEIWGGPVSPQLMTARLGTHAMSEHHRGYKQAEIEHEKSVVEHRSKEPIKTVTSSLVFTSGDGELSSGTGLPLGVNPLTAGGRSAADGGAGVGPSREMIADSRREAFLRSISS